MFSKLIYTNPLVYLFRTTWKCSEGNHRQVYLYWTLFVLGNISTLLIEPFLTAKMINIIQLEGITKASINSLLLLLGISVLATVLFWSCHAPARVIELANAFKARVNYRNYLIKGVMDMPLEWHVEHHTGQTIDRIEKGTTGIYNFAEDTFLIIYAVVELVISLTMLAYFSHSAGIIVIGMMFISVWITMRFDNVLIERYRELSRAENKIAERVIDSISNISTLITLRVERIVFKSIMHMVQKPYNLDLRTNTLSEIKWGLTGLCCRLTTALVLGFYFWDQARLGTGVLIGSVFLLISYLRRIEETFFRFTGMYGDIIKRRARVNNAEDLSKDFSPNGMVNHVLPDNWRELQVRNLSFSYKSESERDPHIDDISFKIKRGKRIALVGQSGSGKTTLLKLIRDLYHPQNGEISVDDVIIPNGFNGISQAVTLVPQDPEILSATIETNITLGAEYDLKTIHRFTDMACFTDVIIDLPKGLESTTKEKGVNLSGGQKQRLALARGLLACLDKEIILLDEPTSSLDSKTEREVYRNIFNGFVGTTIVSSIHRLHLLPLFDEVWMFKDGKIIAQGTLRDLIDNCSDFQVLWDQYRDVQS